MPPWCWFYPDLHWPSLLSRAPGTQPKCHALSSWPHIHCMNLEIFNLWYKASPQSGSAPQTRSFLFPCSYAFLWYIQCVLLVIYSRHHVMFSFIKDCLSPRNWLIILLWAWKVTQPGGHFFYSSKSSGHGDLSLISPRKKKKNKTKTCPSGYVTFPAHSKIISLFLGILHSAKEVFIIKIRGLIYFL